MLKLGLYAQIEKQYQGLQSINSAVIHVTASVVYLVYIGQSMLSSHNTNKISTYMYYYLKLQLLLQHIPLAEKREMKEADITIHTQTKVTQRLR